MRKNLLLIGILSIYFASCSKFLENDVDAVSKKNAQEIQEYISSKNLQTISTQEGIHYFYKNNSLGRNAEVGDEVTIHYSRSLLNGTPIDSSSRLTKTPVKFIHGYAYIPCITEATKILKEGERGVFLVPSAYAFGTQTNGNVPANSVVRLDMEILKLRSEDQQIEDYVSYLKAVNLSVTEKTSTGLRFVRELPSNGTQLKAGLLATVKYEGYLASNVTKFDSGQIDVALGDGSVVKGFEEGLLKMKVGEKAILIFPSSLGYGTNGSSPKILPYSPLIFKVEVISAK